jgi:hypothetical protein
VRPKSPFVCSAIAGLLLLVLGISWISPTFAAPEETSDREVKKQQERQRKKLAEQIERREEDGNGIFIRAPQVYDDSSLQQMLNAARMKLAALQGLDQASLLGHLGAITGSTFQQSLFSAQVSSPSLPSTVTTANGPTSTVATTTGSAPATTTTTTAPNQSVGTTSPTATSPIPGPPTDTAYTLPTTFSGSASDVLNEEMQLTYEIANLQLLLEGSLSDRFVKGQRIIKRRTTVGFPVNFTPGKNFKDAIAVVEVEVARPQKNTFSNEPPAVTALLPREKTYNVAAIKDRTTSIGAGIVTSVVAGGASWTGGRKTFYVVQDQDTVALSQPATDPQNSTAFSWQFRPVLGESFVRTGMRQAFVQLAVPVNNFAGCFGKIHIRTYWRKYDQKHGIVKQVIASSIREQDTWPIPVFDLAPTVDTLHYEDLGGGQVQVEMGGHFLSGTYIRIGNSYYREGTPGFTSEATQIRFIAPALDIAVQQAYIVSRDGAEVRILDPQDADFRPALAETCEADPPSASNPDQDWKQKATATVKVSSFDDSNVLVEVHAINLPEKNPAPPNDAYYLQIGSHLFGLRDAPFARTMAAGEVDYHAVVPASALASVREITLLPLFWKKEKYAVTVPIPEFSLTSGGEKLVLIEKTEKASTYLLYGNRLKDAKVLAPSSVTLKPVDSLNDDGTIRLIDLTADQLKAAKQIVLQKASDERPTVVAIPAADAKDATKPALTPQGRITVGMDEVVIAGDGLDKLKAVRFKKTAIKFSLSDDKKSVTLSGLAAAHVTATPTEQTLEFEFEGGQKSTIKVDVINGKVETVERTKN